MNGLAACCLTLDNTNVISLLSLALSSLSARKKPPQGTVLFINLLGKGLTPRTSMGDGGSIWQTPGSRHGLTGDFINTCSDATQTNNRSVSYHVMAAVLVDQNKEKSAMLVDQDSPQGIELLFLRQKFRFVSWIHSDRWSREWELCIPQTLINTEARDHTDQ